MKVAHQVWWVVMGSEQKLKACFLMHGHMFSFLQEDC